MCHSLFEWIFKGPENQNRYYIIEAVVYHIGRLCEEILAVDFAIHVRNVCYNHMKTLKLRGLKKDTKSLEYFKFAIYAINQNYQQPSGSYGMFFKKYISW